MLIRALVSAGAAAGMGASFASLSAGVAGAQHHRAEAVRLRVAAVERLTQLDDDSAIALYRAARKADPTYVLAQLEFIRTLGFRFRFAELHREFATTDTTSPLKLCLQNAAFSGFEDLTHRAQMLVLEKRFGPTQCTDAANHVTGYSAERSARAMRDTPELAEVWGTAIGALRDKGDWNGVERTFVAALRAIDDPTERMRFALYHITWRMARHDTAGALALWNELDGTVKRDGRPGPVAAYLSARCINREHPDPRSTDATRAEYCRRFFALVRARGARFTEYVTTRTLSEVRMDGGAVDLAIPLLVRLTSLADSLGIRGLRLQAYTQRSRAYAKAGQLERALADGKHAVSLAPGVEMSSFEADAWHNLAHAYEGLGRFAEAAAAADTFATTADINPGATARWMSRHDAGEIRWKAGWHAAAKRDFETMKRIVDEMGNNGHYFVGEYLERKGELGQALEYYRTGASLPSGDPRTRAALARVYETLGFPDSAEAAARAHDADPIQYITGQPMLPELLAARGKLAEAVALSDAWARRVLAGGNVEGAAMAHITLAELLLRNRNAKAAFAAANTADSLTRLVKLTSLGISARTLMGRALIEMGERSRGLATLQEAVRIANAFPSTEALRATNLALGDALRSGGKRSEALAAYDRAATAVERMTSGLSEDAQRAGLKAHHLAPFDGALRTLLAGRAFEDPANAEVGLAWSVRRKAAALRLAGAPGKTRTERFSAPALRARIRADEALVDYSVMDSTVWAIVARRDGVRSFALSATTAQLEKWIAAIRRPLIAAPGGQIDLARTRFNVAAAESLYAALIVPLSSALGGAKSLAIAPDGALWYVPFAALVTANGRPKTTDPGPRTTVSYLVEKYELRLLPSAQFLGDGGDALPSGFRVEALMYSVPGGADEMTAIRSALGGARVALRDGAGATEAAALTSKASVLHLAVHGMVDDRDPLASHLRLAPDKGIGGDDGLLHLSEVAAVRLAPSLVVLTACEAVSGKLYAGEGLVGLARAFLVSGARQVIASEWPVDASAAELTGALYRELARGRSSAAALRSAQLALLAAAETKHPIHWAGFVVFDGGTRTR
jgi:tetratricopeptide (TPR) repeat protein